MHRYYCEHSLAVDTEVTVDGNEAHHLLHVMRTSVGQEITLFDGGGAEFTAQVCGTSRRSVTVRIVRQIDANRELGFELTIGSALPKGDRQRFLVEKLAELGVTRFVPLRTQRSVVQPSDSACRRLRKASIEASKQCGRNRLLQVTDGCELAKFLAGDFGTGSEVIRLIAHPYDAEPGGPWGRGRWSQGQPPIGNVAFAIGPEGGFSEQELAQAKDHNWQPISLGPRILRIETAAIALAAIASS